MSAVSRLEFKVSEGEQGWSGRADYFRFSMVSLVMQCARSVPPSSHSRKHRVKPAQLLSGVGAAPISAGQVDSIPSGQRPVTAWEARAVGETARISTLKEGRREGQWVTKASWSLHECPRSAAPG